MHNNDDESQRLSPLPESNIPTRMGLSNRHYDSDTIGSRDASQSHKHFHKYGSTPAYSSNDEDSAAESWNHRYDSDNNDNEDYRRSGIRGLYQDNIKPMFDNMMEWTRPNNRNTMRYQSDSSGDEFDNDKLFNNMIKTGRQRKKLSARSRGGEFMMRRKKRRVYFCCLAKEIDVEKLHDTFSEGYMDMYGKLFIDVLYLYENKAVNNNNTSNSSSVPIGNDMDPKQNSTTEESEDISTNHPTAHLRRRSSGMSMEYDPTANYDYPSPSKPESMLPIDTAGKLWQSGGREVYIFNFGAVVYWGYNRGEEFVLLNEIRKYILDGELTIAEFERCDDDMAFIVSPNESSITIANDVITCPEDADIKSRLSVSFAVAQCAVLALFEGRIDSKIHEYKYIPETLALSGRVKLSQKELANMIGDVLSIRHDVNLNSEIMSTPDFFWREDDAVVIYRMTMAYLEMDNRTEVVNTRLNMLRDLLVVLQHQCETVLAVQLEWVVIWLIVVSIVLEVMMIVHHHIELQQL